jgi:hypothetical protein
MAGVADFPIFFVVEAKADQAIASFQKLNLEMDKMAEKGLIAGGSLGKLQAVSKVAGTALLGIGTIFAGVAYESVKAAMDVTASQAKLKTAITDTGVSYNKARPAIEQVTQQMANLTFTSSDVNEALASMTAATRSPETALKAMGTIADLAAFQHESLASAANTVSRAVLGQAKGLSTLGIAFNKTIPKGATYEEIMKAIQDRTKGAAKAAADAQPWKVLQSNLKLIEEQVGGPLLSQLGKLSTWFVKNGIPDIKNFGKTLKDNKTLVIGFAGALGTIWAVEKMIVFYNFLKKIYTTFKLIKTGVADAYKPIEDFFKAFSENSAEFGALKTLGGIFGGLVESISKFLGPLGVIIGVFSDIVNFFKGGKAVAPQATPGELMTSELTGVPTLGVTPSMSQSLHNAIYGPSSKQTSTTVGAGTNYLSNQYLAGLASANATLGSFSASTSTTLKGVGKNKRGLVSATSGSSYTNYFNIVSPNPQAAATAVANAIKNGTNKAAKK